MKRKLEAELISIAHRILKLKNKSELQQLQDETLKLYEKISVLRFVEENFNDVKPTIGYAQAEKEVEAVYEAQEIVAEEPMIEPETEEVATVEAEKPAEVEEVATVEDLGEIKTDEQDNVVLTEEQEEIVEAMVEEESKPMEEIPGEEDIATKEPEFMPLFEIDKEESEKVVPKQITLEDFLSEGHVEPVFVRAESVSDAENETTSPTIQGEEEIPAEDEAPEIVETSSKKEKKDLKKSSLNDSLSKTINIGLNDRIGFEKHLFGGSSEDLNRVLSQLSTYSSFSEAQEFIEDMVKPDYNNWAGKEEYETRFMELIEKKFS